MELEEDSINIPTPFYLGILGSRDDATPDKIRDELIIPILSELGRCPERLTLPAEGYSSIFLQDWAEQTKVQVQTYECDWKRHGRRAKIFRDGRIEKESTHFLIFLNKKSAFYESVATRLVKKGAVVFTVAYGTWELEQLVLEKEVTKIPESPPSSYPQSQKQSRNLLSSYLQKAPPHPQTLEQTQNRILPSSSPQMPPCEPVVHGRILDT